MPSESSKQGHTKRINPTIWTESEFYSILFSFIVRLRLSDIRSGSSFRARFPSADVGKRNLSCTRPFPNASFIRLIRPCLSDWDDICGTKRRLKCPKIFFLEYFFFFLKSGTIQQQNAHHSIQSKRLPCLQSTGVSSWSLLFSVDLFSAVYGSNWYGCRPYYLLAFSGRVLSSSESLLSQDKCRWSSSISMIHKWRNKSGTPKSNRKLHFSWLQVNISIFPGRYWEKYGEFRARVGNQVLLEVALQFYLIKIENKYIKKCHAG